MNGFAMPLAVSANRWVLAGSLLLATAVRGDETPTPVQYSDEGVTFSSIDEPSEPTVGQLQSFVQPSAHTVVPAPYAPTTNSGQYTPSPEGLLPASYGPPCNDLVLSPEVPPNMIGDFFGAVANRPLVLPGTVVDRAIFIQPFVDPLDETPPVDHLRGVDVTGIGTYETTSFVYLANSNGQPAGVVPNQIPPQLLQQFDGSAFLGELDMLGLVTDSGPFMAIDSGNVGEVTTQVPLPPAILLDQPIYNIYDTFVIYVPSPGTGGGVGRQKIAENSSPIPRDRVFLNHSTLSGVPLTPEGINVYRFTPGIEKTFFDQWFSVELRLPFATTIDSDIGTLGVNTDTESTQFGNIVGTLKALVRRTPTSALAIGLSVAAPTAKDMTINDVNGAPFLSVENQSTHLMPFIGGMQTRGRAFSQWFVQGDIDATGSDVELRNIQAGTYGDVGQIQDASFLYVSASFGYWIYQNGLRDRSFNSSPGRTFKRTVYSGGGISGFAPTIELHYNRAVQEGDTVRSGPLQIQSYSNFELANLVLGGVMTFGSGGSLTASWGTPVLGQDDKQFAHEARLMFDYEY